MVPEVAQCQIDQHLAVLLWDGQLLEMFVHKGRSWNASYNSADLKEMAQGVRMTTDGYVKALFDAISGHQFSKNSPLMITERDGNVEIMWSKKLNERGIKLKDPDDSTSHLIQRLLLVISHLSTGYSVLKRENGALKEVADLATTKYDTFVEETEKKEIQWFSKFSAILNEKKSRIKQMEGSSKFISGNPECTSLSTSSEHRKHASKHRFTEDVSCEISISDDDDLLIPKLPKTSRHLLSRLPKTSTGKSTVAIEPGDDPSLDDLIEDM